MSENAVVHQSQRKALNGVSTTSHHIPGENMNLHQLTLFAEDSPARMCHLLENEREWKESAQPYGQSLPVSLAKLSPDGSWLKTYQGFYQVTTDNSLQEFCMTWPRAGTMQNGTVFQLQPLVPITSVIEFSLWPTPTASKGSDGERPYTFLRRAHRRGGQGLTLAIAVACWPNKEKPEFVSYNPNYQNYEDFKDRDRGYPNPEFTEWLMGFPIGWTDLEPSATQ